MHVEHWMQFSTFAEKDFFIYPSPETYQGIVLNANMVVHASAAMAAFLIEKRGHKAKYLIDPMTHAFQHDPVFIMGGNGEPKSSIKKLSEEFGKPVTSILGLRGLSAKDFADENVKREFVRRVLDFQYGYLSAYMEGADSYKYLLDEEKEELRPYALIAPYFYIDETNYAEIVSLNTELLKMARELKPEATIFGSCVLSQGALTNDDVRASIIDLYDGVSCDGFTIWVDEFVEQKASIRELEALVVLAKGLKSNETREAINLHGGYFSIAASASSQIRAFTGVCHGPEFGESRAVVPVGGGIPISRYYVPDLHTREKYRDVLGIFSAAGWLDSAEAFHEHVCDCMHCQEVINGNVDNFRTYGESDVKNVKRRNGVVRIDFPTSEAKAHCLRHYLERKQIEFSIFLGKSTNEIVADLDRSISKYDAAAGESFFVHLKIWKQVLENLSGD